MRSVLAGILVLFLGASHVFLLGKAAGKARELPLPDVESYVMPAPILKITTLEFDGLASDYLFLQALVFRGKTLEPGRQRVYLSKAELWWLYAMIQASSDLDPYFLDPYYFANANFTWGADIVKETNNLLEKGVKYREWDWLLPFYVGFNYFYFLQDDDRAAEYLMIASRRPRASTVLASLASKLAYKKQRTELAILYTEEMMRQAKDEVLQREFEMRLQALKGISQMEKAVSAYHKRYRAYPFHLQDLVATGFIEKLPDEPYGGKYYIDPAGNVKTTSESRLLPAKRAGR